MLTQRATRIKILMLSKGVTGSGVAAENGWSRSYVSQVIVGRKKNKAVQEAIANALECNVADLWTL